MLRCELIVQRLDAQPVARDEEALTARVPDGEGKHATQMLYAVGTIFFVKMNDGFRVAVRAVSMTQRLQLFAQSGMIVNFTVENNPGRAVFVAERLVSGRQINDAEAAHADPDRTRSVDSFIVRAAMDHGSAHPTKSCRINPRVVPELHDPGDAAHLLALSFISSKLCRPHQLKSPLLNRARSQRMNRRRTHRSKPVAGLPSRFVHSNHCKAALCEMSDLPWNCAKLPSQKAKWFTRRSLTQK